MLKNSEYFDSEYYLKQNADVAQAKINPLLHYLIIGGKTGRDPSANFSSSYYLNKNSDVKEIGINPLIHYISYGKKEGRVPKKIKIKKEKKQVNKIKYKKKSNIAKNEVAVTIEKTRKQDNKKHRFSKIKSIKIEADDYFGYRLDIEGLSSKDEYLLNEMAIKKSTQRFLNDMNTIYSLPIATYNGVNILWENNRIRRIDGFSTQSYFYFICAKLRILLEENAVEVQCYCDLNKSMYSTLKALCKECGTKIRRVDRKLSYTEAAIKYNPIKKAKPKVTRIDSLFSTTKKIFNKLLEIALRPIILGMYNLLLKRANKDGVIWFHVLYQKMPIPNYLKWRFGLLGDHLSERNQLKGYFFFSNNDKFKVINDIIRGFYTREPVICLNWYITDKRRKMLLHSANRIKASINEAINALAFNNNGAEFDYLLNATKRISAINILNKLEQYDATLQFSKKLNKTLFIQAEAFLKNRYCIAALRKQGHRVLSVSDRFYTKNRLSNIVVEQELSENNSITLPDSYAIFDQISKQTLMDNSFETNSIHIFKRGSDLQHLQNKQQNSNNDEKPFTILILLQTLEDKPLQIIQDVVRAVEEQQQKNAHIIIKSHPNFPPEADVLTFLEGINISHSLYTEAIDMDELTSKCDIAISAYSTATLTAVAQGKPIIWLPYISLNSLFLKDVYDSVGIKATDPSMFRSSIQNLITDKGFYQDMCEQSTTFSQEFLNPSEEIDTMTLVEVVMNEYKTTESSSKVLTLNQNFNL